MGLHLAERVLDKNALQTMLVHEAVLRTERIRAGIFSEGRECAFMSQALDVDGLVIVARLELGAIADSPSRMRREWMHVGRQAGRVGTDSAKVKSVDHHGNGDAGRVFIVTHLEHEVAATIGGQRDRDHLIQHTGRHWFRRAAHEEFGGVVCDIEKFNLLSEQARVLAGEEWHAKGLDDRRRGDGEEAQGKRDYVGPHDGCGERNVVYGGTVMSGCQVVGKSGSLIGVGDGLCRA